MLEASEASGISWFSVATHVVCQRSHPRGGALWLSGPVPNDSFGATTYPKQAARNLVHGVGHKHLDRDGLRQDNVCGQPLGLAWVLLRLQH